MSKQPEGTPVDGLKLPISRLVLGTMTFGDTADEATAGRMVDEALAAGITTIDTANAYVGGATEEMLSRVLKDRRADVVLASKAGMPHADHGQHAPLSREGLRNSVEGSLRRLGVDSIDLFYLHQPDRVTPLEETLSTVAELAAEGKIGALGVSNFAAWQIADVIHVAREVGAPRPVVAQQLYNLVARRVEEEYLEFAATHQVHTMVYNPLGGGLLTGKHSFEDKPSEGRFGDSKLAAMYTQRYWDKQLFEAVTDLAEIAAEAGITLAELSLRWLAYRDGVGSMLLGGSKVEQLQANIAAVAKGPLPADVTAACDAVGAGLRGPMPAYNR
ncbi:aryl-alcohol dehydrogenase-like predicted oxidoreductase [Arthrobacter sp. V4I6]|uniref:aldo/keto reductase n=1 Tax=unclassified Arthrobacter TaxID=235627 RepID=UPI002787EAD2|nr:MULTISPECIES: aldo/keto reductase [unclassified Arthrobacter]MDQ0822413.1 aryl-alcohol dehydrogenase-like predicted oxidoreductase [Arthrobacter sp. V1I7]MDQ0852039.1 aryl-alcohol dehydrogenase-like predicted oxidoreductase [Arthrobacter sp. V4I6]